MRETLNFNPYIRRKDKFQFIMKFKFKQKGLSFDRTLLPLWIIDVEFLVQPVCQKVEFHASRRILCLFPRFHMMI